MGYDGDVAPASRVNRPGETCGCSTTIAGDSSYYNRIFRWISIFRWIFGFLKSVRDASIKLFGESNGLLEGSSRSERPDNRSWCAGKMMVRRLWGSQVVRRKDRVVRRSWGSQEGLRENLLSRLLVYHRWSSTIVLLATLLIPPEGITFCMSFLDDVRGLRFFSSNDFPPRRVSKMGK